jgi:hypothetical protein
MPSLLQKYRMVSPLREAGVKFNKSFFGPHHNIKVLDAAKIETKI